MRQWFRKKKWFLLLNIFQREAFDIQERFLLHIPLGMEKEPDDCFLQWEGHQAKSWILVPAFH